MAIQLLHKKFTIEEFQQMAETGILKDDDRVELLKGEIIEMGKIGRRHAAYVDRLNDLFRDKLGKKIILRVQSPIELYPDSQPQPDVSLLQRREDYYENGHPQPEDIFLLVEVADTSIETDREVKIPLYSQHGIIEVWLIDINSKIIEVYQNPTPEGYKNKFILLSEKIISPLAFPDIKITTQEILGN
jgi:Uma2 family endonuclease